MSLAVAILGPTVKQDRSASVGGVAVHTAALAGALRQAGARVAVLSDSEYAEESGPGMYGVRGASAAWLMRTTAAHPLAAAGMLWRSATSAERRRLGLPLRRTFSRVLLIRRALDADAPDGLRRRCADRDDRRRGRLARLQPGHQGEQHEQEQQREIEPVSFVHDRAAHSAPPPPPPGSA